jgi:hypothetical protein
MTSLRLVSEVQYSEFDGRDPIAWKDRCSPFVLLGDESEYANAITEKREFLKRAEDGEGPLLFAWAGQYSTDVFLVDDLARAQRAFERKHTRSRLERPA